MPQRAEGLLLDKAALLAPLAIDALVAAAGSVLVIAPHPDDETLGCGAAIASTLESGRDVTIALLTDGDASHPASVRYPAKRLAALRRAEFAAAVGHLRPAGAAGTLRTATFGLPDTRLAEAASDGSIVDRLCEIAADMDCGTLWSTWRHDPHCDHEAAASIADRVGEGIGNRRGERAVVRFDYAVWGRFGDAASGLSHGRICRFASGRQRPQKLAAMACYRSQLTPLITDDPAGFVMPPALVDHFGTHDEIFIAQGNGAPA